MIRNQESERHLSPGEQERYEPIPATSEIHLLFEGDQRDRREGLQKADMAAYLSHEKDRAARAHEIYEAYKVGDAVLTPRECAELAMIFHHRDNAEDYYVAYELAKTAVENGEHDVRWLQAAAEDRYLLSIGKRQKWGTQFRKENGKWAYDGVLAPDAESGITDEMRAGMNVPIRSEQLQAIAEKYKERK